MTMVSVIIPAFNAAWCVAEALDSVRLQDFGDYEVLVVNDGSTDATKEIVEAFFSATDIRRARLISQANKGLGAARNAGLRRACGEYVAFLDADDIWHKTKLSRMMFAFEKVPRDVGLLCHDEIASRNGKCVRVLRYGPSAKDMYRRLLLRGNCLSPSAVVVRREILESIGGFSEDPNFHSVEDYDLWLRLSQQTKFRFVHEVLGNYRLHPDSLGSDPEYNLRHRLNVFDRHVTEYFKLRDATVVDRLRIRLHRSSAFRGASRLARQRENVSQALAYAITSITTCPVSVKNWISVVQCAAVAVKKQQRAITNFQKHTKVGPL